MEVRRFGPLENEVPVIGLGTWQMELGDRDDAILTIRRAIDRGDLRALGETVTLLRAAGAFVPFAKRVISIRPDIVDPVSLRATNRALQADLWRAIERAAVPIWSRLRVASSTRPFSSSTLVASIGSGTTRDAALLGFTVGFTAHTQSIDALLAELDARPVTEESS